MVDDLIAILIIAIFYSSGIKFWALGLAFAGLVLFWFLHRRGVHGWYLFVPLAFVIWALMHESGVHATVAGVAMGLMLRCHREGDEKSSPASTSSTWSARSRPGSPYRSSRCSPPG